MGIIRRSLIQDVFRGKEEMVLNYNPHPSTKAGIGQIICPKIHVDVVLEGLKKKITRLSSNYNPLEM